VERSQEHWKSRVKELEEALAQMKAKERARERDIEA